MRIPRNQFTRFGQRFVVRLLRPVRKHRVLTTLAVLLLLVSIGLGKWVSMPSVGHTVATTAIAARQTTAQIVVPPPSTDTNSYYRLDLPTGFVASTHQTAPAGLLYIQAYINHSAMASIIAQVSITTIPEGGISNDSAYSLRQKETSRYHMTTMMVAGQMLTIASDNQAASVVAFWPHANLLATIGVTTGTESATDDGNAAQLSALTSLVKAWHWQ